MLVYRLAAQSPVSDPSFHNASEAERLRAYDEPPIHPMCWRSGQRRAAVRNVTGRGSAFLHSTLSFTWKCSFFVAP